MIQPAKKIKPWHGTLVATFITPAKIFLFSDGRVINRDTKEILNDFSKVHTLTKSAGMLTLGEYMPTLKKDIQKNCELMKIEYVNDVAAITEQILKQIWENSRQVYEDAKKYNLDGITIFVFVTGFDKHKKPHLYYFDSRSETPFAIKEHPLFTTGNEIEIAAMSSGSGHTEDPVGILSNYITKNLVDKPLEEVLNKAFDFTKDSIGKNNDKIGGETFYASIDSNGNIMNRK